jgi:hypothetical protein
MNIEWGERISQMHTSVLQVEWLGAEHAKAKVLGSSAANCEVRKKSRDLY